jgi:hypothetical protein
MQYLSMVRPQLVHAVISCPDKDAYKCTLLGLSLGGSEPIAKWHGSSSVHVPTHGTDESQVAVMLSNAKWADVFKKFEADKRALRGGKRRGAFAKLDASTKTKLNEAAKEVDAAFKEALKNAIEELGIDVQNVGMCVFDAWSGIQVPSGTTFGSSTSTSYGSSSAYESSSLHGTSADDLSSTYYGTTTDNSTHSSYDSGSDYSYDSDNSSSFGSKDAETRMSELVKKADAAMSDVDQIFQLANKEYTSLDALSKAGTITAEGRLKQAQVLDNKTALTALHVAIRNIKDVAEAKGTGTDVKGDETKNKALDKALAAAKSTSKGLAEYRPKEPLVGKIKGIVSLVYALHDTETRRTVIDNDKTHLDFSLFTRKGVSSSALHDVVSKYTSLFLANTAHDIRGIDASSGNVDIGKFKKTIENASKNAKSLSKGDHREKARECAGFVAFRGKGVGAITTRTLTVLLNGVFSDDDSTSSLITAERLKSGVVRSGVTLDSSISNGKNKTTLKKLIKPKFASQMQQYHENMLAAKSAISTFTVRLLGVESSGPVTYSVTKSSAEHTAIAMNVLTQIAIKVAPTYAQSVQQFYETANALSVNLTSSLVTTKSNSTPEEESLFDQRSADEESDTETGDISFFDDGY